MAKTNQYIFGFTTPNVKPNHTFTGNGTLILDENVSSSDIMNGIIAFAIKDFNKSFPLDIISEKEISFTFISLVNTV